MTQGGFDKITVQSIQSKRDGKSGLIPRASLFSTRPQTLPLGHENVAFRLGFSRCNLA